LPGLVQFGTAIGAKIKVTLGRNIYEDVASVSLKI